MAFDSLLDHACDIYHMRKTETSPGYNLPSSPSFSYASAPDLSGVPCHFGMIGGAGGGLTVIQTEPQANLETKIKLALPLGTDVRLNDKIVDRGLGYAYTAEVPRRVRDHHIVVMLRRTGAQEAL